LAALGVADWLLRFYSANSKVRDFARSEVTAIASIGDQAATASRMESARRTLAMME
jgi:hypothetical protein